jgi:DNA helicase-2/ATP-dependent DNA helicase PcrA
LYRTNAQSRVLEEALRKQAIPYKIYGGLSFYQRKEIKDLIAYFRLISNQNDEEALKRIINVPARGIGDTTVGKLFDCAQLQAVSVWEILSDMLKYNLPVNAGTATKLANFRDLINSFSAQINQLNAYELAQSIVKASGMLSETFLDRSPENLSKQENVQELLKAIHEFCEEKEKSGETSFYLPDYLAEISLLTDQDTDKEEDKNRITLMTVHAAKGLEFRAIFIVGMEEELFPSPFNVENDRDLEEERRLFYVAITRAEERCFISYARSRFRNGKTNFSNPSRFLKDIDSQYLDYPQEEIPQKMKTIGSWDDDLNFERMRFNNRQSTSNFDFKNVETRHAVSPSKRLTRIKSTANETEISTQNSAVPTGAFVKHSVFGIGKVLGTSLINGNEKAEIDFGEKGVKSLLLKFAKLEVLK